MVEPGSRDILVVDDEPAIARVACLFLRSEGFPSDSALTCADAIAKASAGHFGLALVDLTLPDGSGLALAQELRERFSLPSIAVSARPGLDRAALATIFVDFLQKPYDPSQLFDMVRKNLTRHLSSS